MSESSPLKRIVDAKPVRRRAKFFAIGNDGSVIDQVASTVDGDARIEAGWKKKIRHVTDPCCRTGRIGRNGKR